MKRKDASGSADTVVNPPGETPGESNKFIQVTGADPADGRA